MSENTNSDDSTAADDPTVAHERRHSGWLGRAIKTTIKIFLVVILLIAGLLWYTYRTTQNVPEFYQSVLDQDTEQLDRVGDQFESNLLEMQNATRRPGQWQIVFTQDEINGWLAADLPEKFPNSLPSFISDPRVSISEGEMKMACRFDTPKIKGIVVAETDVFSTDSQNTVGFRIKSIRTGIVPLPIAQYADRLSEELRFSNVPIEWTEIDGDPVALITIPDESMQKDGQFVVLETLVLVDGEMIVGGTSKPLDDSDRPVERENSDSER